MLNPATNQVAFRGRNDNGGEGSAGASWKAGQNADWTQLTGENFRIRFEVQEAGGANTASAAFALQYNLNGAGWVTVTTMSSVARLSASSHVAHGLATTDILTAGTGGFTTGQVATTGNTGNILISASTHTEVEFCLRLRTNNLVEGDTVQFRVLHGNGTLNNYTVIPTVTAALPPLLSTGICEVGFGELLTPSTRADHALRVRALATEEDGTLTFALYQGAALIASATVALGLVFQTHVLNLTEAQASDITNYADLRVRWSAQGRGSSYIVRVADAWLMIPPAIFTPPPPPATTLFTPGGPITAARVRVEGVAQPATIRRRAGGQPVLVLE